MEVKKTLLFFSANCLLEKGVVMASAKAAGDMEEGKSLPVGTHPEPAAYQHSSWFLHIAVRGVTDLAVVLLRLWALWTSLLCCILVLDAALEQFPASKDWNRGTDKYWVKDSTN